MFPLRLDRAPSGTGKKIRKYEFHTDAKSTPFPEGYSGAMNRRYPALDLLRTLAIAMMVTYHAAYDLEAFYDWNIDVQSGGWLLLARATLILFLLLVGASFAISWDRSAKRYGKYLRRGLGVLACGLLVSIVTAIADPATFVRFGVLHMIAVSILLLPFVARFREWNVLLGIVCILLGQAIQGIIAPTSLLLPLGIAPTSFASVDYVPLLPWFGVVLLGYALGYFLYVRHKTKHPQFFILNSQFLILLGWPGRHALAIYLLHQPLLLLAFKSLAWQGILP